MLQQDLATGELRTREMSERIALADVRYWQILLQKSKIERSRKSRER